MYDDQIRTDIGGRETLDITARSGRRPRSVMSMFPQFTRPGQGVGFPFRRDKSALAGAGSMNAAEQLEALKQRLADMQRVLDQVTARTQRAMTQPSDMSIEGLKRDHRALCDLLQYLDRDKACLERLRDDLSETSVKLLGDWRVSDREIMAADASTLRARMAGLSKAIKREHVLLTSHLIEQG
ncbi:MAG: hypothetical protein WAO69_02515 [Aestuariivita sp.]|uniref:hypothetical protein n=1 Tax=Aestuariivita sp. TaxID=1872407 RepID=UPI003BAF89EC